MGRGGSPAADPGGVRGWPHLHWGAAGGGRAWPAAPRPPPSRGVSGDMWPGCHRRRRRRRTEALGWRFPSPAKGSRLPLDGTAAVPSEIVRPTSDRAGGGATNAVGSGGCGGGGDGRRRLGPAWQPGDKCGGRRLGLAWQRGGCASRQPAPSHPPMWRPVSLQEHRRQGLRPKPAADAHRHTKAAPSRRQTWRPPRPLPPSKPLGAPTAGRGGALTAGGRHDHLSKQADAHRVCGRHHLLPPVPPPDGRQSRRPSPRFRPCLNEPPPTVRSGHRQSRRLPL